MSTTVRSHLELLFAQQVMEPITLDGLAFHLPVPERDYRFHPTRKWAFDFAWPQPGRLVHPNHIQKPIAVEIEGGSWVGGAHVRGKHFESDAEKYAEALIAGWRVLRVTTDMVTDGRAIALLVRLFES